MKCTFLQQTGAPMLLLFFNGWGMDESVLTHLAPTEGVDVLMVCDYTTLAPLPDLSGYTEHYVVAWSLGVLAAAAVLSRQPLLLTGSVAVNGTLRPVDALYGIPPALVQGTIQHWLDASARAKFYRRVSDRMGECPPRREPVEQQRELEALVQLAQSEPALPNPFRRAVVSARDRIMPVAAQNRFWAEQGVPVSASAAPHDLFAGLASFREVIDLARN